MKSVFNGLGRLAAAMTLVIGVGSANAGALDPYGPYTDLATCDVSDVSAPASACFGFVDQYSTNALQVDPNKATFLDAPGQAGYTGLFGTTNWKDVFSATSGPSASFGQQVGTFTVNWNFTGPAVVMLQAGALNWSAYLINDLAMGTYTFDLPDKAASSRTLSAIRILAVTSPIPLPAALPLFGLALGGLAFAGRRRRKMA